jgi:hypothetical protein
MAQQAALPTAFRHGFTPSAFACSDVAIAQPWFMTRTAEVSHRIGWTRRRMNSQGNCASSSKLASWAVSSGGAGSSVTGGTGVCA